MNRTVPVVANIKEGESVSVVCYANGTPTPSYFWKFLKNIPGKFLTRYLERKCFRDGFGRFHTPRTYKAAYKAIITGLLERTQ